jgi:hypothetical protein
LLFEKQSREKEYSHIEVVVDKILASLNAKIIGKKHLLEKVLFVQKHLAVSKKENNNVQDYSVL